MGQIEAKIGRMDLELRSKISNIELEEKLSRKLDNDEYKKAEELLNQMKLELLSEKSLIVK